MKQIILAGTCTFALAGNVWAQSSITLYGSLDAGVAYVNNSGGHSLLKFNQSNMQPDRWGLRGVEDLGGGLSTIFRLENGFSTGTGAMISSGTLWNRQAYVGLSSSSLGTLTLGHQSSLDFDLLTPLSNAYLSSTWNAFHPGNIDGLANTADSSIDNAVKYRSVSYGGFSLNAVLGLGNTSNFGYGNTVSVGGSYANGPLKAAVVYSNQHDRPFAISQAGLTSFQGEPAATYVANHSQNIGAGLSYQLGDVRMHALYTRVQLEANGHSNLYQSYDAGVEYQATITNQFDAGAATTSLAGHRWTQADIGYIYSLSKSTQLYLQGVYEHGNSGTLADLSTGGISSTANQVIVLSGIHHSF